MYIHFRCSNQKCLKLYAVSVPREQAGVTPTKHPSPPMCRACDKPTVRAGYGAGKVRKGAIELTAAAIERRDQRSRQAVVDSRKQRDARFAAHRGISVDSDDGEDEEDEGDEDFLPRPDHTYNLRMRLTPGHYAARHNYGYDASCVLRQQRDVLATAGRLNLNLVMGRALGAPRPFNLPAWKHAGTTKHSVDKYASSEWCHLVADSLGGPSVPLNVAAASYSANTYMAAMEVMLKGQASLTLEVTFRCSAPHVGEWIFYRITHRPSGQFTLVEIDARAGGFSATDLTNVQTALRAWLAARGIAVQLTP